MSHHDSATRPAAQPLPTPSAGLLWGLVGVAAFSFTVPLTRVAVGGLSPLFIGSARAVVAAVLAAVVLATFGPARPAGVQWLQVCVVAAGVVVGFPLLTSYALATTPASHGAVVIALLPAVTAVAAVLRTGERPGREFWLFSVAGAAAAVVFALLGNGGLGQVRGADLLLFGAVAAAAIGYAEGGLLAREIGSWQTISWALVVSAPLMLGLAIAEVARVGVTGTATQWASFGYLAVVSMYLGFFAWYRGLAIGPIAHVSQVQLVQPVLTICWAALLLDEQVGWRTFAGGLVVIACAGGAVRSRIPPQGPAGLAEGDDAPEPATTAPADGGRRTA